MNDNQAVARGQQAEREWSELEAAFTRTREAILNELAGTPPTQSDKVLRLHMAVQNLTAVKVAIRDVIDNGRLAEQALAVAGLTRP